MSIDYNKELNKEQYEVVTKADGPCLVLAGAGSGKTRTIVYRVAYLVEKGVSPANILLVTFTNKAANEMLERVARLLHDKNLAGLNGGTFHHLANKILRKNARALGYSSNFTILDQEDSQTLIKNCLKELKIDVKEKKFPQAAILQDIFSFSKNSGNKLSDVLEMKHPHWQKLLPTIEQIYKNYEQRKKTANLMDFDDLLLNLLILLKDHPNIKETLAEKFQYILVDEYQDTNKIQAEIIRELADCHHNVLVVGDDAQSIYSFRAADLANILNFPKIFKNPKIFQLQTNYRSTPEILDLANCLIAQNINQFPKNLTTNQEKYLKPYLVTTASTEAEARFIAEQIVKLNKEGLGLSKIAVLFRATFHSQELEFELASRGLSYEYRGGLRFFERSHIKDLIAFLKVINNVKDELAWARLLNLQIGIGELTAKKLAEVFSRAKDLKDCLKPETDSLLADRARTGWRDLKQIFEKIIKGKDLAPGTIIKNIGQSNYRNYLELNYQNFTERLEEIEQLGIFAEKYESLTDFLAEITMQERYSAVSKKEGANQEKSERLILSTIHQAKGLEWETVFVINLTENSFPHPRALQEKGGLEEERRLLYVAITRAQRRLFLCYPLTGGRTSYWNAPSPFIKELPENLWEEASGEGERPLHFDHLTDGGISYLPDLNDL